MTAARLAEEHLPFVRRVAARMASKAHPYLEIDDLIGIGAEALVRASEQYDPRRGASFSTFAYLRVRGAMIDGIGMAAPLPRGLVRRRHRHPERRIVPRMIRLDEAGLPLAASRDRIEELIGAIDTYRRAQGLGRAIASLAELDRGIICRHYIDGDTLDEIGRAMNRSRSWASRVHTRALARLRAALEPPARVEGYFAAGSGSDACPKT